jgi:hypothetical protein
LLQSIRASSIKRQRLSRHPGGDDAIDRFVDDACYASDDAFEVGSALNMLRTSLPGEDYCICPLCSAVCISTKIKGVGR